LPNLIDTGTGTNGYQFNAHATCSVSGRQLQRFRQFRRVVRDDGFRFAHSLTPSEAYAFACASITARNYGGDTILQTQLCAE
jgi:hypothetical protein